MIVYDDLRPVPLFKPCFEACGEHHANHFRNVLALLIFRSRLRRWFSVNDLFEWPDFSPDDNTLIVFDTHTGLHYLHWLEAAFPEKRIILWHWNPVMVPGLITKTTDRVEKWTYSRKDAEKWGMRLNTQFFFDCFAHEAAEYAAMPPAHPPRALFIGRNKGRAKQLEELKTKLESAGAICDFRIIPPPKINYLASLREKLIPYREVIDAVEQSSIIIDLYADPTGGLSLRALEALFFCRKLITNRSLMRDEDFYDRRNIYILGEDDRTLQTFLAEPIAAPNPEIRNKYLFSNWLKRFQIEESRK